MKARPGLGYVFGYLTTVMTIDYPGYGSFQEHKDAETCFDRDNEEVDHEHQEPCQSKLEFGYMAAVRTTWLMMESNNEIKDNAKQRQRPLILVTFQFHVTSYGYIMDLIVGSQHQTPIHPIISNPGPLAAVDHW
ncbi:predicted protein [Lichtheimia corymbifera JMRC:FSU:9682]|uniref:Uncharacterized protein n=1 Tax=Lichtheimia corymbifera JMRC:FSU:9682 TaxID=1263082 RepID=A0A068RKU0_9FUNG|nr:predicted protein [Lichtheimia corymbifera JMRC:FSU:9682]